MQGSEPVAELARRIKAGEAAIFPTDTLPALASRPDRASLLWELKQRPQNKPVILMAASATDLWPWLAEQPQPAWLQMADRHWPGALTLVLPTRSKAASSLNPGGTSLGLRVPASHEALQLLRLTGPLATTSANRSGEPACLTAEQAASCFPNVPRMAPVPWPQPSGQASTVLLWTKTGEWRILRQGAVLPEGAGD